MIVTEIHYVDIEVVVLLHYVTVRNLLCGY